MTRFSLSLAVVAFAAMTSVTLACPFCGAPSLTLAEQMIESDAVVLAKWAGGEKPTDETAGSTNYEIVDIAKGAGDLLKKGQKVSLIRYRAGKAEDLFVLMGTTGKTVEWGSPLDVSKAGYDYLTKAPSPKSDPTKRLRYFLQYLEHEDVLISNDAYAEFAAAR